MTRSRPSLANKVQSEDKFAASLSRVDKVDKRDTGNTRDKMDKGGGQDEQE